MGHNMAITAATDHISHRTHVVVRLLIGLVIVAFSQFFFIRKYLASQEIGWSGVLLVSSFCGFAGYMFFTDVMDRVMMGQGPGWPLLWGFPLIVGLYWLLHGVYLFVFATIDFF